MKPAHTRHSIAASSLLTLVFATPALAQGIGGLIKQRAQEKIEQKIVECLATDLACINKAKSEGKEVEVTQPPAAVTAPATAATGATAAGAASASLKPGEGAWVNYDFKPGDQPLFVEDFSKDEVGNFPRRLEFESGNIELAEWQGGRYLRVSSWSGKFAIKLADVLPDRFTIEFDATAAVNSNYTTIRFAETTPS